MDDAEHHPEDPLAITMSRAHWDALATHAVNRSDALMGTGAGTLALDAADEINKAMGFDSYPPGEAPTALNKRELEALVSYFAAADDVVGVQIEIAVRKIGRAAEYAAKRYPRWH